MKRTSTLIGATSIFFLAVVFFGNLFASENYSDHRQRKIFIADVSGGDPRITYYVAANGNDGNPGTINQPFASLEHARDAIRAAKNTPNFNGAAVYIRAGIYTLNQGFALSQADSGAATAPIVYQAYQNEKVVLSGGKTVTNFVPVPDDNPVAGRFDPSARPHIMQADLRQAGITDFGVLAHANYLIPSVTAALGVFFNDQPVTLARWPNTGWEKIAAGGKNSFQDASGRPRRWKELSDIWMHGYFTSDYADDHEKIASLDTVSGTITSDMASFGYAAWQQGNRGGRFYYENVLEELDSPGEWYLDRTTGILYFWPPGTIAGNTVVVSALNSPMISLSNTSYVTFSGLDLDVGRNSGLVINSGGYNNIRNCKIHNMGNDGIDIIASLGNNVSDCEISFTGDAGVVVGGGNCSTLTPANNLISNNKIHDFAQWVRTYQPGVTVTGVGNTIRNNVIYNAPHAAIMAESNDHTIEYNEIYNVAKETCDVGAIYIPTSHDWQRRDRSCSFGYGYSYRGNSILYNYIHDISANPDDVSFTLQVGIYVDDIASGTTIFGNIINKVPGGIIGTNGGRNNRVENNISINNSSFGVSMSQNAFTSFPHSYDSSDPQYIPSLYNELLNLNYKNPPYSKYPDLETMWEDQPQHAKYCTILNNIFYSGNMGNGPGQPIVLIHKMNGAPDETGWAASSPYDASRYTEVRVEHNFKKSLSQSASNSPGDPEFASPSPNKLSDFELAADSPMWALGFQRIPIEKIGYFSTPPPQNPACSRDTGSSNGSESPSSQPGNYGSPSRRPTRSFSLRGNRGHR